MDNLLSTVKQMNQDMLKKPNKGWFYVIAAMITLGVLLLLIDTDTFITFSALLIWLAMILLIITIFRTLLRATYNQNIKLQNSVKKVYQSYVSEYNNTHQTNYQIDVFSESLNNLFLLPSFTTIDQQFVLYNDDVKMVHMNAYTSSGANQKRTHYLRGLYIIMNGPSGDMQYRDSSSFVEKIIHTLQPIYGKDTNDVSNFDHKEVFKDGTFYSNPAHSMPVLFKDLLSVVHKQMNVSSVDIGLQDHKLHISIEEKQVRLPYIKKYQTSELTKIKEVVNEHCDMLHKIEERMARLY